MSYIGNQPSQAAFLTDQFNGTGSATAFTMSVAPANTASVLVAVSGVLQDPSTYSVSGLTLTFSAAPPSGTGNISVRYLGIPASGVTTTAYRTVTEFTATAGQTTFTPPSYTAGFINVYRNGVRLNSADFTASNGTTVVLANAATVGDAVTTESFYVSSVLNAIPAVANAVTDTYLNTGAVTQAKLAANVAGTGPAFSATNSSTQSISSSTFTKVVFPTTTANINSNYSTATSTFTPTVAGYYWVQANIGISGSGSVSRAQLRLVPSAGAQVIYDIPNPVYNIGGSALIYFNGTTDSVYVDTYITAASPAIDASSTYTRFSACLIRAA